MNKNASHIQRGLMSLATALKNILKKLTNNYLKLEETENLVDII